MSQQQASQMAGPPYASTTAGVGGLPTLSVDIPATSVFLALYLSFAVANMTILQINNRRGIKFILNGLVFGFCMARITTCVMRIVWATHQTNVSVAIAANIFVNAGILLIYIINIIFAQRILRAKQPQLGWNKVFRTAFKMLYAVIGLSLVGVIISAVLSLYTLDTHVRQICRDLQLAAITYLFVFTLLPLFLLGLAFFLPKSSQEEHFGQGSTNKKALVLLGSTLICVIISGFKCGSAWEAPRPATNPAWYQSKAAFYVFNFTLEIMILALFMAARIDKLFVVPNGSNAPGDYTSRAVASTASSEHGDAEVEKV